VGGSMIEISLFGETRVRVDGAPVTGLSGKQRQILAILALAAGSAVSKERLADLLWQGAPPASYVGTLDSYLCLLRRHLGLSAGRGSELATTEAGFRLVPGPGLTVDLARFRDLAQRSELAGGSDVVDFARQALEIASGELISDVPYADWAVRARESLRRESVTLWLRAAQWANARGESAAAERLARAAVASDPVCEDAWRQLMLAHWLCGRRGQALAAYAELRAAMAEQLGDEPGTESRELYLTILRDTATTGLVTVSDSGFELRMLLLLMRQALDGTPGIRVPARDSALSEAAALVLARAC
jgi:DNA-binding SARP family transcriptional activator